MDKGNKKKIKIFNDTLINCKYIFLDVIGFTNNRSVEAQTYIVEHLNDIVIDSIISNDIPARKKIFIPTGDGICIALLNYDDPYDVHICIALSILKGIAKHNKNQQNQMLQFEVRVGINENQDNLIIDINDRKNLAGTGINNAQRIMSVADNSQILVGQPVYEKLVQRDKYMGKFKGYETTVKNGGSITVHHYIEDNIEYLNKSCPKKFQSNAVEIKHLSEFQSYYFGCILKNQDFFFENINIPASQYIMTVINYYEADELYNKKKYRHPKEEAYLRFDYNMVKGFERLSNTEFCLVNDLAEFLYDKHLRDFSNCFQKNFGCFQALNRIGVDKLKNEWEEIWNEFGFNDEVFKNL